MPEQAYQIESATLPARFARKLTTQAGVVEQLLQPEVSASGVYSVSGAGAAKTGTFVTTDETTYTFHAATPEDAGENSLLAPKAHIINPDKLFGSESKLAWIDQGGNVPPSSDEVRRVNAGSFRFAVSDPDNGVVGLRTPQIGALHATLGHWSVSTEPVTIVMPTGTGKTETMLALVAQGAIERLLVIVPSNALRGQTYRKFLTLGLLPKLGVLGEPFAYPIVGRLDHRLQSAEQADELFGQANVIVATIQALTGSSDAAKTRVAELCSHLFVDEAHHVAAPTWREVKNSFSPKPIVQFTATPYRRDNKRVDGKILYNYPLRKAQSEGYFAQIQYRPVFEFSQESADKVIAETAIQQLRDDLGAGFDHILMARVDTIKRAESVLERYQELGADLNPILVHSQLGVRAQREALEALNLRTSRAIVCVDMLGEGFDLPQLKIAAIHDSHKSLAITLQFTGRFTRSAAANIGTATMVANAGDASMEHSLRQLYAEDADWNRIIRVLGENEVGTRVEQSEFLATFPSTVEGVPIESILPKMSTVVYKTECELWTPEDIAPSLNPDSIFVEPVWSQEHKVALFVTREFEEISWAALRDIQNLTWHLYLVYWDEETKLLYVNSSNNDELHQDLANAASGGSATKIHGEVVYRALANIQRLMLMNLGLLHATGRAIRHTMHNGSDVGEQLKPGQLGSKSKTNLFARGYENGERVSIGCSQKGRVWSFQVAESIPEWVSWCRSIGSKLIDETITEEQVLRGVMRPEPVTARPELVAIAVDWNSKTYMRSETALRIRVGESLEHFYDVELTILRFESTGDIQFAVVTPAGNVNYRASFTENGVEFSAVAGEAFAVSGRGNPIPLSSFFRKEPPAILFEQDTFIEDNLLYVVHTEGVGSLSREQIETWDWNGVDLSKESQREERRPDCIQRKVIDEICTDASWEFVFDDDSSGECADVVAVKREGIFLHVDFFHCKFATGGTVGARVGDLYQVCGQAQKSIRWRERVEALFAHLKLREAARVDAGKQSRIEKGDARTLFELINNAHLLKPVYRMFIVQPGLSKTNATDEQLRLLGATEQYLAETFAIPLRIIASP